ncbi:hypothetical protein ACGF7U_02285 [Micromonospora sp. NPDC047670]|uniref:hypothetical protein n=1 Tax=Micromonospora sp. NPDC047670 TaxID=3364252 RepID=UPI0037180972
MQVFEDDDSRVVADQVGQDGEAGVQALDRIATAGSRAEASCVSRHSSLSRPITTATASR